MQILEVEKLVALCIKFSNFVADYHLIEPRSWLVWASKAFQSPVLLHQPKNKGSTFLDYSFDSNVL